MGDLENGSPYAPTDAAVRAVRRLWNGEVMKAAIQQLCEALQVCAPLCAAVCR